ncbi:glycoside hydrolase superfamily [Xylariomycetidae sp. FL0641]|nr:glycoside hydrolase superfamily [Xylariomycetidae sp. FL0641]
MALSLRETADAAAGDTQEGNGTLVVDSKPMASTTTTATTTATPSRRHCLPRNRRRVFLLATLVIMVVVVALALGLGLGLGLPHGACAFHCSASSSPSPLATSLPTATNATGLLQPAVGTSWDYPLGYTLTPAAANASTQFYVVDLENTPAATVAALAAAGHDVVCYFSAGSVEAYRPDAGAFPSDAVGQTLDGWPDERWLDVRSPGVREVMTKRITNAKDKGCQGIDPDNVDGYDNDSGFPLTQADAVDYVRFLAQTARAHGLATGLKNAGDIVESVTDVAAWAVVEQCAEYDECDLYAPFVRAGKPVFHVEYTEKDEVDGALRKKACGAGSQMGFSSIVKHLSLDEWVFYC